MAQLHSHSANPDELGVIGKVQVQAEHQNALAAG
jgi:hypothetical protein